MEEQKDRFAQERLENTEPESDDVEGHRLANRTVGEADEPEDERNAEPDVEAHQLANRQMNRQMNREADRNYGKNID